MTIFIWRVGRISFGQTEKKNQSKLSNNLTNWTNWIFVCVLFTSLLSQLFALLCGNLFIKIDHRHWVWIVDTELNILETIIIIVCIHLDNTESSMKWITAMKRKYEKRNVTQDLITYNAKKKDTNTNMHNLKKKLSMWYNLLPVG